MSFRLIGGLLLASTFVVSAHLCNDVFVQARDNLAVKVDIRDGQLRINKEASFRVYLLNTMDRDIVDIRLEVISPEFDGRVTPSTDWKGFPHLKTSLKGGKKEFFDVMLKRKSGTADGKYTIGLRLFNGKDRDMEFKTVAIADAMGVVPVPRATPGIKVDGAPQRAEWTTAALVSGFSMNTKREYTENKPADCETRVRFVADDQNLYALVTTPSVADNDRLSLYFAADTEATVRRIDVDLKTGTLTGAPDGAAAMVAEKGLELCIPLRGLNLPRSFLINLARQRQKELYFWRGPGAAIDNAVVFARLVLAD